MAPSPEPGQPKAPDKVSEPQQSTVSISTTTTNTDINQSNTSGSVNTSNSDNNDIIAIPSGSGLNNNSMNDDTTKKDEKSSIKELNDIELKNLLDEAYDYKSPKDLATKSSKFKELLRAVEREDNEECVGYTSKLKLQGGSLQDLGSINGILGDGLVHNIQNNRNSCYTTRQNKRITTSVSSRQREGGSLPSNVNVSSNSSLFVNDDSSKLSKYYKTDKSNSESANSGDINSRLNLVKDESHLSNKSGESIDLHKNKELDKLLVRCEQDIGSDLNGNMNRSLETARSLLDKDGTSKGILDKRQEMFAETYSSNLVTGEVSQLDLHVGHSLQRAAHSISTCPSASIPFPLKTFDHRGVSVNSSLTKMKLMPCNDGSGPSTSTDLSMGIECRPESVSLGNPLLGPNRPAVSHLFQTVSATDTTKVPTDDNGNVVTLNKAKKKINRYDRKTVVILPNSMEGYRGGEDIDTLVAFIENKNKDNATGKSKKSSDVFNSNGNNEKNNKKKNSTGNIGGGENNKKDGKHRQNKMNKSNSLEELSSNSKLGDELSTKSTVTMRSKQNKKLNATETKENVNQNSNTNVSGNGKKENVQHQANNQKQRGERRSWGTEELNFLGESSGVNETITTKTTTTVASGTEKERKVEKEKERDKEKEKSSKQKSVSSDDILKRAAANNVNSSSINESKKINKSQSIMSIESLTGSNNETAEFHVVTKKKKAKKRQPLQDETKTKMSSNGNRNTNDHNSNGTTAYRNSNKNNYQVSQTFVNDRDAYMNHGGTMKNRRKSTSSMPPSDKSDCSDVDSNYSLPIESTTLRNRNVTLKSTQKQQTQSVPYKSYGFISGGGGNGGGTISYADIAKNRRTSDNNSNHTNSNVIQNSSNDKWQKNTINQSSGASNSQNQKETDQNGNAANVTVNTTVSVNKKQQSQKEVNNKIVDTKETTTVNRSDSNANTTGNVTNTAGNQKTYSRSLVEEISPIPDGKQQRTLSVSNANSNKQPTNGSNGNSSAPSTDTNGNCSLQKSKSVENENYCNIDQYPALEKTVKPQKQHQSSPKSPNSTEDGKTVCKTKEQPVPSTETVGQHTESNTGNNKKQQIKTNLHGSSIETDEPAIDNTHLKENTNDLRKSKTLDHEPNDESHNTNNTVRIRSNYKKERNSLSVSSETSNSNKVRPPVIIMNDSEKVVATNTVSPLMFGDFNEDDLHLLDEEGDGAECINEQPHIPINENIPMQTFEMEYCDPNIGTTSSVPVQQQTQIYETNEVNDNELTISPQSDAGYISVSSNNRSIVSTGDVTINNDMVNHVMQPVPMQPIVVQQQVAQPILYQHPHIPQMQQRPAHLQQPPQHFYLIRPNNPQAHPHHPPPPPHHMNPNQAAAAAAVAAAAYVHPKYIKMVDVSTLEHQQQQQQQYQQNHTNHGGRSNKQMMVKQNIKTNNNHRQVNAQNIGMDNVVPNNNINNNGNSNDNMMVVMVQPSATIKPINAMQRIPSQNHHHQQQIHDQDIEDDGTNENPMAVNKNELNVKYLPPKHLNTAHHYNHDKIVSFIESSWDELMCRDKKPRYYS